MKIRRTLLGVCFVLSCLLSQQATADNMILDDLIIDGSLCVGLECADGEVFDFDTIKLKSATPQIRFEDTSTTASFPSSDWLMGVEKSASDISYFYIKDIAGGTPKTVMQLSAASSGGIALGVDADLVDNTVSVGSTNKERKIIHVADGVNTTDAVNVGQLQQFQINVNSGLGDLEAKMDALISRIESLESRVTNL